MSVRKKLWRRGDGVLINPTGDNPPVGFTPVMLNEDGSVSPLDELRSIETEEEPHRPRGAEIFGGAGRDAPTDPPDASPELKKELSTTRRKLTNANKKIEELQARVDELNGLLEAATVPEEDDHDDDDDDLTDLSDLIDESATE